MTELSYKNKKQKQKRIQRMIIKRYGNPSDLFGAIIYLISDCSNYLTGQDIYIDGGLLSKGI
jgi:NAD(P)-dependent dehydrogenase (short-subunit alcohol dehydrogenase family)